MWRIENINCGITRRGAGVFSFGKARNTLERWFRREHDESTPSVRGNTAGEQSPDEAGNPDQRVQRFMEELKASSQEWLGRVRMINFESIRERVGSHWEKLQDRVEILAEKIIREEMAPRDRYVNAGDAEFLVFFADATPEESRIRCLAIVEAIHEKLFGIEDASKGTPQRVAECHVVHKDDLILKWEAAASSDGRRSQGVSVKALRKAFRHDPEALDGADIATSTQIVIDSILSRGSESKNASELAPLLVRLQYLSRSLKVLEPVLIAAAKNGSDKRQRGAPVADMAASEHEGDEEQTGNADTVPLGTAWDDITKVIAVLDTGSEYSHADLLEALQKLQRTRLDRAGLASGDENYSTPPWTKKPHESEQFGYVPVYRSISQGERIHQGLYRVSCSHPVERQSAADSDDAITHQRHQAALEQTILEHSIQYLLDRSTSSGFVLMTPVNVETLRSPSTQRQFSTILRSAELRAKRRLLIEIIGYSQAENTIGMRRAIDELRLHSHAIFITLSYSSVSDFERIAAECKKLGAHAIGIDASQFGQIENVLSAIIRLASVASRHSLLTYVDGIQSVPVLAKAIASGISYVCAPALRPALQSPDDAERTTLGDLFSAI